MLSSQAKPPYKKATHQRDGHQWKKFNRNNCQLMTQIFITGTNMQRDGSPHKNIEGTNI